MSLRGWCLSVSVLSAVIGCSVWAWRRWQTSDVRVTPQWLQDRLREWELERR